jgi:hypothetical protein
MPRILINEKDKTSPGTPAGYANYTVLIAGFKGEGTSTSIEPDSNGVYEFSTAQAFEDTIGLVPPKGTVETDNGPKDFYHYGNQMAYELLNMGYSVVYKPIKAIDELTDSKFWEVFKDKASYDFRFITHGLLESSGVSDEELEIYNTAKARLADVEIARKKLEEIFYAIEAEWANKQPNANSETEKADALDTAYIVLKTENIYEGLKDFDSESDSYYENYTAAVAGTTAEKSKLEITIEALANGSVFTDMINQANGNIANLARYVVDSDNSKSGRGDCIALIEVDEKIYLDSTSNMKAETLIINAINDMSQINAENGKYCAMTVPSVHYKMADNAAFGNNKKFPGAFHYLACFINSLKLGFAEWYAAAGYTRGVSSYMIDHTSVKLGEIAINALEPRYYDEPQENYPKFACNVIANFRGSYYLWGNRTAHPLGKKGNLTTGDLVASSFLNIRQLCCTIKKQLYVACRTFTFDPNSDTLWVNFVNAIRPTLEAMKADQGIRDYKVLKVYTDTKATLKAKIRIIPIEAVEDFDIEVSLEDSFGETAVDTTESI